MKSVRSRSLNQLAREGKNWDKSGGTDEEGKRGRKGDMDGAEKAGLEYALDISVHQSGGTTKSDGATKRAHTRHY